MVPASRRRRPATATPVSSAKRNMTAWLVARRRSGCCAGLVAALAFVGAIVVPVHAQSPPVGTVYALRKPIAETAGFVGRVEAIDRVEIRARVQGYLEQILFKEGDFVKTGDPLYRIEKGPFQAAVEQAQAALDRSKAEKILTEVQLKRQETLLAQNSTAASARDQARAADEEAAATILSNQASLDVADINLGYTEIVAPISGKISRTNITVGNVVGPDSGPLTLIVSQDPMYVTFPVSQREILRVQESEHRPDIKSIKVKIRFANGATYNQEGSINFIDVSVNRSTDTVIVRAKMPNPAGLLIDGQLVSVTLEAGRPAEKVVVPQAALIADQEGVYVFVVEDGKAVVKRIKVGAEDGPNIVVDQGLQGGEQVIVEGIQSIRPGQPVQASPMPPGLKRS
jgi:membrane fusion protein, multidrug efflux system